MINEATLTLFQFAALFCTALVFLVLALERRTIIMNLVCSIFWCALAISNFMIGYTIIGSALSWIFGVICFVIMGNFVLETYNEYAESQKKRYRFDPF